MSRKFFAWGDKNIIDVVSQQAQIKGGNVSMPETGTYGRGGSYYEDGLWLVDEFKNGSQPYNLFSKYSNVALLQEKFSDVNASKK